MDYSADGRRIDGKWEQQYIMVTIASSMSSDGQTIAIGRSVHDGVNGVDRGLVQVDAYVGSQ